MVTETEKKPANGFLDLVTLRLRQKIRVDGVIYELRNASEFTFSQRRRIERAEEDYKKIQGDGTADDNAKCDALSIGFTSIVKELIVNGDALLAKLTDIQNYQIIQHFLAQPAPVTPVTKRTTMTPRIRNGYKRSRG